MSASTTTTPNPAANSGGTFAQRGPFFGKYRGTVLDNIDLLGLGRILAYVPAVQGALFNWALPCAPYAGLEVGFWTMPQIGSNVWIEFEGGSPDHPIWSGCFWEEGEAAFVQALSPEDPAMIKALRTDFCTLIFNDTPEVGGMIFNLVDPAVAVPITVLANSAGIEIQCGVSNILINPEEGITLTVGPSVIAMTEAGIEINGVALNATAEGAASIEAGGELNLSGGGNVSIEGAGAVEMTGGGDVAVTGGGAVEVTGGADVAVTGGAAVEVTAGADVAVTGGAAIQITAIADVATTAVTQMLTGVVEVNGDLLIDGLQPIVI